MTEVKITTKAASNIALIKYMGKLDNSINSATNSSISLTLPHLLTTVTIEKSTEQQTIWRPANKNFALSALGQEKFLNHWERCRLKLAPLYKGNVIITSGNNFPSDCGLASSASSFAALTMAAHDFFKYHEFLEKSYSTEELAQLSREGSGSSCRSFFDSWVFWSGPKVSPLDNIWKSISHSVVVVDGNRKKVSSSEAHQRVVSSSLFFGRIERAEKRSEQLQVFLKDSKAWKSIYELAWSEFWDMHTLFETSVPSFYYMTPKSLLALRYFQNYWELHGDGPIVTMDAGPNVHLLYREDQLEMQRLHNLELRKLDYLVISGLQENV